MCAKSVWFSHPSVIRAVPAASTLQPRKISPSGGQDRSRRRERTVSHHLGSSGVRKARRTVFLLTGWRSVDSQFERRGRPRCHVG